MFLFFFFKESRNAPSGPRVAGAYVAQRNRMVIKTAPVFLSSHGSTHAEDLIRSIGHADLIAGTRTEPNERKRGRQISETIADPSAS